MVEFSCSCQQGYSVNEARERHCHQPSSGMANFGFLLPRLVELHQQEIVDAWNNYFGG